MEIEFKGRYLYVDGIRYICSQKAREELVSISGSQHDYYENAYNLAYRVFASKERDNDGLFYEYPLSQNSNNLYKIIFANNIYTAEKYYLDDNSDDFTECKYKNNHSGSFVECKYTVKKGKIDLLWVKPSKSQLCSLIMILLCMIPLSIMAVNYHIYILILFPLLALVLSLISILFPINNMLFKKSLKDKENFNLFLIEHCKSMGYEYVPKWCSNDGKIPSTEQMNEDNGV